MKNYIAPALFSIAIIIGAGLLANAYKNRNKKQGEIAVTGLGETNFESDKIVWNAEFSNSNYELKQAYNELKRDKKKILDYLLSKGIKQEEIVFKAASSRQDTKSNYSEDGRYVGESFTGYTIIQQFTISSKDVAKTEKVSREITDLLNEGIQITSSSPRYYFTNLDDLKISLISQATENARLRAESMAVNAGSKLGELKDAKMGIFQILGQDSGEDYSWGGTYNTSSKNKTASITMKLTYAID